MDNVILVETFRFFSYSQLSKSSLVSKKFNNLILSHRSSLALLHVKEFNMIYCGNSNRALEIFYNKIYPETYDDWIIRNEYSTIWQFESPESENQISIAIYASAYYPDSGPHSVKDDSSLNAVFCATVREKISDDDWPILQHFFRLLTNPFVYYESMKLISPPNDAWKALTDKKSIPARILCSKAQMFLKNNSGEFIHWINNHFRFDRLSIESDARPDSDEYSFCNDMIILTMTGSQCTPKVVISNSALDNQSNQVVCGIVENFALLSQEKSQMIPSIEIHHVGNVMRDFAINFAAFFVQEFDGPGVQTQIYQFPNSDIAQKLEVMICNSFNEDLERSTICYLEVEDM